MTGRRAAPAMALFCASSIAAGSAGEAPTYTEHVAPIVFEHCAACHRPGESAPFPLLDYASVRRRAEQIALVTSTGFMPPWLPAAGEHAFVGVRRLTRAEIDTLRRWHEAGTPEGDPAALPEPPRWTEGWQLGEPDLIVEPAESYTVPPDGFDVFRNFVIPIPVERARWVRAVELRPGNKRVVHHGILRIDRTPSSRRLDAEDEEPGFGGMEMGRSIPPGGQFLGWTPGKVPFPGRDGMAWRLTRGTDFVLQLHMLPTGKPEPIRPRIGLYFTEEPPTIHPTEITLYGAEIDIPPGADDYVVEDRFTFPVAVDVLGIYPHAHYLGKDLRAVARFPEAGETSLIHIGDWDFNWQDDYRYAKPVRLPAGTTVTMRYVYDNSADNPRNPHVPPVRVQRGQRSIDEMASLGLQVLAVDDTDRPRLDEAKARTWLEKFPGAAQYRNNLGIALAQQGRIDEAADEYRRALEIEPTLAEAHYNLGLAHALSGRQREAIGSLSRAVEFAPEDAEARNNLGNLLLASGRTDEALAQLRRSVELDPNASRAHYNLAIVLGARGALEEAARHYREAIEVEPGFALAHNNLGTLLHRQGRLDEAVAAYREALQLREDLGIAHRNLGAALSMLGRPAEAALHFRRALELDPTDAEARRGLDAVKDLQKVRED